MPQVGGRHYPYTSAGKKAAKAAAKKTGRLVRNLKKPKRKK